MQKKSIFSKISQYLVTLGLATFLAWKYASGQLHYYINERFFPLTLLAVFILWCIAAVSLASTNPPGNTPGLLDDPAARWIAGIVNSALPVASALANQSTLLVTLAFLVSASVSLYLHLNSTRTANSSRTAPAALLILALPVILGITTTAQPLSSTSLENRGVSLTAAFGSEETSSQTLDVIHEDLNILDWIILANKEDDPAAYIGKEANVIGFVFHDKRLNEGQFMLSRFVVTCCVADALAIGLPVQSPEGMDLPDNTWVRVQGTLDKTNIQEDTVPLIRAERIETIAPPEQPYLYP